MPEKGHRFRDTHKSTGGLGSAGEGRAGAPRPPGANSVPPLDPVDPVARATDRPARHAPRYAARYGSSFEARFGRVILQHGIAAIPSAIFHYQGEIGLKAQHVWFISYILSHKWDEDLPYPSLSNMARCSGVSLRNIQFIKSDLCQAGMLEVAERYNSRGGRESNAYDFSGLFAHLEELIAQNTGSTDQPNRIGADLTGSDTLTEANPSEVDPSFVARFGRVIARRGVAAVPRATFTHQKALGLTPQQVWFVSYIFSFQWTTALPYPSINKMVQHTGYSRAHLHTIKAELVEAGYLRLVHRQNEQGGQDSNAYDFSGLLDAVRAQLQPDEPLTEPPQSSNSHEPESPRGRHLFSPRRGQGGARQRAGNRHSADPYEAQHTGVYESQQIILYEKQDTGGHEGQKIGRYEREQPPHYEGGQTRSVNDTSYTPANVRRPGPMKPRGHESEQIKIEANDKKDDSNRLTPRKNSATRVSDTFPRRYSQYIASVAADLSRELGDATHEASNMRQALNLWQASGLSEHEFVQLMQEARKLTRRYQSRPTWDPMENKMAYYFATLRRHVATLDEQSDV
jgi:hypothetical protein